MVKLIIITHCQALATAIIYNTLNDVIISHLLNGSPF